MAHVERFVTRKRHHSLEKKHTKAQYDKDPHLRDFTGYDTKLVKLLNQLWIVRKNDE